MATRYDLQSVRARLLEFALELPDAHEDHPWDSTVVKTNGGKKIFVFLGHPEQDGYQPSLGVKLVDSHDQALQAAGAAPSGYGLGRSGWVTVPFGPDAPPVEVLEDWIEESYRTVALKRNVKALDARHG